MFSSSFKITHSLNCSVNKEIYSGLFRQDRPKNEYDGFGHFDSLLKPKFYIKVIDYFFYAIWKGDRKKVFDMVAGMPLEIVEVALDLAIHFHHEELATFFKILATEMIECREKNHFEDLMEEEEEENVASIYKRFKFSFDLNEFFNSISIQLHACGTLALKINCHIYNQEVYVRKILSKRQRQYYLDCSDSLRCFYNIFEIDNDVIRHEFREKFTALNQLQNENFDPLYEALEVLLADARNGFPISDTPVVYEFDEYNFSYRRSTYADYLLYKAVVMGDSDRLITLFQAGADPNSYFNNKPILIAALSTAFKVMDEVSAKENNINLARYKTVKHLTKLIRSVEIFLENGVDPFLGNDSLLHELIFIKKYRLNYEPYNNFFQDIIHRLPITEKMWRSILIHYKLTKSVVAKILLETNKKMLVILNKNRYVDEVENQKQGNVVFYLKDEVGKISLSIETHHVSGLETNLRNTLEQFFVAQSNIAIEENQKIKYLENELKSHSGTTFVDIIRFKNEIVGFYIYEYINTNLNSKPTFIHYLKLIVASLERYPELVKFIILMRSFACTLPGYTSISFAEIASQFGFCLGADLKRYPAHHVPEIDIKQVISIVKNEKPKEKPKISQTYYYFKEKMSVPENVNKVKTSSALIRLSHLSRKTFNSEYYLPGHALCIAFLNDNENFQRFKKAMLPVFGEEIFSKLLSYHVKSVNDFIITSGNLNSSLKPRL